jgi:hypothetical protein
MRRVALQTKTDPDKLYKIPEIEPEILYLFGYYTNLKGRDPLTFLEIDAWQRVTGLELCPGEVEILFLLDTAFYLTQSKLE